MKKLLSFFVALQLPLIVSAIEKYGLYYNINIDNIYYKLNSSDLTASVSYEFVFIDEYTPSSPLVGGPVIPIYSNDYSGDIVIPTKVTYQDITYTVTSIDSHAFEFNSAISSVTIPNSVTTIGYDAFWGCSGLAKVISKIKEPFEILNAFYNIPSDAELVVPPGTKSLYESTKGWDKFSKITESPAVKRTIHVATAGTLPDLISEDEKHEIEELTLTGELNGTDFKYIREMAGDKVSSKTEQRQFYFTEVYHHSTGGILKSLDISNAMIVGGGESYNRISNFDYDFSIEFLSTIENKITPGLFSQTNLKFIKLPNNLTSIDGKSYNYMVYTGGPGYYDEMESEVIGAFPASLSSITIPNSVSSINSYAFYGCTNMTSVIIGNGITSIGNIFSSCENLQEMILSQATYDKGIPASVTKFTTYSKNPMRVEVVSKGVVSATMKIYPIDEQGNTNENNYYTVTTSGQTPGQYIKWKLDDENYGIISEKTEGTLTLETQPAQPTSTTKARLIATVNEADDDQHFGFEWLRYGAPESMRPNKVYAPLYNGQIVGSLSGLNPDIYYNYRPFYKSDSGEMVYGEWVTFLTGDANVFFEPETHTKEADRVTATGAHLSGVWIEGTDDIQEKGFEYWTVSGSKTRGVGSDVKRIVISGNQTSATLEGLKAGITYGYRSYIVTAKGTTYSEDEKTFQTILIGDVDDDGKLTNADADAIAKHIIGQTPSGFNKKMADVNEDGYVNVVDIVWLTNMIE